MSAEGALTGAFMYADGSTYHGQFIEVNGKPQRHGAGVFTTPAFVYDGQFANDQMHGAGKYAGASGDVYTGSFVSNTYAGEGKYSWADGALYVGSWYGSRMHGSGEYTSASGVRYAGEFVHGLYRAGKAFVSLR